MIALPSVQVLSSSEETVKELTRRLMISITQFGFCVGDLKSDPCPHAMNCLSCARLVVCKGATKGKSLVEDKIKRLEGQYRIIRDHVEKDGGKRIRNGKILAHLQSQIDGAKDLLTALNDPNIPDGSILARSDKEGAITASFSDRVTLFAAQQRELQNGRRPITDG